nr:nucleotidyltransferase [uncultured Methanoregula sp.]
MPDPAPRTRDETMIPQQELMGVIRSLKGELATRYDVREVGIIGPIIPDAESGTGRIHLLVEFGPGADLVTLVGLRLFLEEHLGMKVNPVSKGGLRPGMRDEVMQNVVFV